MLRVHSHVQYVNESFMRTGNRFKFADAGQLSIKWTLILKRLAIDNLDRTIRAHHVLREPHFTITAATNAAHQFVLWNDDGKKPVALLAGGWGVRIHFFQATTAALKCLKRNAATVFKDYYDHRRLNFPVNF